MKFPAALLVLLGLVTVSAKDKDARLPDPAHDKVFVLEPMKVDGKPIISFAIDITVYADPGTKKVKRIFISHVYPDTDAARSGLQRGDEIVQLDGVAVTELDARVAPDSALGRVFLNRNPGQPLDLEVLVRRPEKFTLHAQRATLEDLLR